MRALTIAVAVLMLLAGGAAAADEWKQAIGPWQWSFPRDHGNHPEYRTEWWYFTGNLRDAAGKRYGYQLTFFRQGIRLSVGEGGNAWSIRDVYLAHFAISDVAGSRFFHSERASRRGPGLAGAREGTMDVRLLNWWVRQEGEAVNLYARDGEKELKLRLLSRKPMVFHGKNGLSRKGPAPGQASYYYSYTNMETSGTIALSGGAPLVVTGSTWFDHEFGSNQLTADQVGWDWFALRLSDGREVMLYVLRRKDGSVEPASSGTVVEKDGKGRHLPISEVSIEVLGRWRSPKSGGTYPAKWRIVVKTGDLDITVMPLIANQELITGRSTGITYWEGVVAARGKSGGRDVTGEGYVELTGYAGSLGGVF
jgi:predicted secreted hydrolase